jgi:integral membrane sensor domain MASE1
MNLFSEILRFPEGFGIVFVCLFVFMFIFFCGAGDQTCGLVHAKQDLTELSVPQPFYFLQKHIQVK